LADYTGDKIVVRERKGSALGVPCPPRASEGLAERVKLLRAGAHPP
jgi:hypothetical protein